METEKLHQKVSLALRPRLRTALRERFTKGKDTAPQALPQQSQQKDEAIATQFHLFSYLPTELRLQIWEQATRYKRYVILDPPCNSFAATAMFLWRYKRYREACYRAGMPRGDHPIPVGDRKPAWTTRTPPPPLLSVSREAREVALKTWQLAFDCCYHPAGVVRRRLPPPFFLSLPELLPDCSATGRAHTGFPSCGQKEIRSKHVPSWLCVGP